MSRQTPWRFACPWPWLLWLVLACGAPVLQAQSVNPASSETIDIRAPFLSREGRTYQLHAKLQFALPVQVEQMVHDGATLNFTLQLRVSRDRRWWRNATLNEFEQRYQVQYHSVSERYVVRNQSTAEQNSYATLTAALESLKAINNLMVLDEEQVNAAAGNEVSLRALIEVRAIPRALGMLLFWVDDYSLESDWYTWPLKP